MAANGDKVKVLHVTNAYPYEGVPDYGIFIREQIDSLKELGVETSVVFLNGRKEGRKAYLAGIPEIRRSARTVDVIHCHHLYSALACFLAFTGKPVVLSFLNDWLFEMDGVRSKLLRIALCHVGVLMARRVIFKSPVPQQFRRNLKYIHLPNGVDGDKFDISDRLIARKQLGLDPDAFYLLFVSSKEMARPQKRYDLFSAVINILNEGADPRRFKELVLVNQPRDRVVHYFNAADVHFLTSDYEGSPNSVKEALCCGTPVVARDVGNVREMLDGVPHSWVIDIQDTTDVLRRLRAIELGTVDRSAIRAHFLSKNLTRAAVAGKLIAIYDQIRK